MISKRRLLAATAGLAGGRPRSRAQPKYPSEPIKLVVPRAPGGGIDILARLLQPALEKKLGVPVIVDNRPDAAAVMGATIVTKAKPDGYTFYAVRQLLLPEPGDPRLAALRHAEGLHRRHHAGAGRR